MLCLKNKSLFHISNLFHIRCLYPTSKLLLGGKNNNFARNFVKDIEISKKAS